jgi:hypothetical protein
LTNLLQLLFPAHHSQHANVNLSCPNHVIQFVPWFHESTKSMQCSTMWSVSPSLPRSMLDPQHTLMIVVLDRIHIHIHTQSHYEHNLDSMLNSSRKELNCNMQSSPVHPLMIASKVLAERSATGARQVSQTPAGPNKDLRCRAQPGAITL